MRTATRLYGLLFWLSLIVLIGAKLLGYIDKWYIALAPLCVSWAVLTILGGIVFAIAIAQGWTGRYRDD